MSTKKRNRPVTLEDQLQDLLTTFHNSNPKHPMFGPVKIGLIRAPYQSSRSNGVSWTNFIKTIANKVSSGSTIGENECWMVKTPQLIITKSSDGKTENAARFLITRFLCFLKDPTDANWTIFSDQSSSIATPFSHFCGRGQKSEGQDKVCINGIEHGHFSTQEENESHKLCKFGSLATCPGHGVNSHLCIFTHSDGKLKPCLMFRDHIPICNHSRKCFPFST